MTSIRPKTSDLALNVLSLLLLLLLSLPGRAQNHDRLSQGVGDGRVTTLRGSVNPQAQARFDQGRLRTSQLLPRLVMGFSLTPAQQTDLDNLLHEQQDPSSPNFHKWLTPEQYGNRFGLSQADLAQVTDWLRSQGFTVVEAARSRTYVAFRGTVAQVESALHTEMHQYLVDGQQHFANATDVALPGVLGRVVQGIRGLHDFHPRPRGVRPRFTSDISGKHFLAPDDFATIYDLKPLYSMGIDGTGQTIAVVGQSDLVMSDIQTFRSVSGLQANTPQVVLVPGSADPGVVSGDVDEASLDVEWSGAVARNATIIFVNSGNGAFDSLQYAIDQNLAPVISVSYGDCEQHFTTADLNSVVSSAQQANAQGITIVAASGDSGAADCDYKVKIATQGLGVDVPAALPNVTGAGGTEFNEGSGTYWSATNNSNNGSALSYIPEVAWNDTTTELASGGNIAAGGGGVSTVFPKPNWQAGSGVPNDNMRDVPDISFTSSFDTDGYLICSQGSCVNGYRDAQTFLDVVGGTSAAAPTIAGVVTLINQYTQSSQGNINPRLYQLAAVSTDAFHDITSGNNMVPCRAGSLNCPNGGQIGYTAGPGYDRVTGLGSVDAYNLAMEWVPVAIAPNPINFGSRLLDGLATVPVSLRNNNIAVLNIGAISVAGNFGQNNNCPGALAFGASCTINVTFLPTSFDTQNGTLTITADDSSSPHQVAISGAGADLTLSLSRPTRLSRSDTNLAPASQSAQMAPVARVTETQPQVASAGSLQSQPVAAGAWVSEARLEFDSLNSQRRISLANAQSTPIKVVVTIAGPFAQANDCGEELKAGASCQIDVSPRASEGGARGELKITTPDGTNRIALAGEKPQG